VVPFTPSRFFLEIDVTVNLHGVPLSGHVRSNSVLSYLLQYTTLNTMPQLYKCQRECRGKGQRRRPCSFHTIRNRQHCAGSASCWQALVHGETNTEPICRRSSNPNHLRNIPTHVTVQAQTLDRGAWVF